MQYIDQKTVLLCAADPRIECFISHLKERRRVAAVWQNAANFDGFRLARMHPHLGEVCPQGLAIDRFDLHELPALWGISTTEHFGGRTHGEFYRNRFAAEIARGQLEMVEGDSAAAISDLPDGGVDLFYVDADHSYDGARRDLEAILPKVKPDGCIVMNDYIPAEIGFSNGPYGVIQATNEFMVAQSWEMVYFALAYVMYCDVGLRRVGSTASDVSLDVDAQTVLLDAASKAAAAAAAARWPVVDPTVESLKTRVAALDEALAAIRQSTSWRITAPLRAIGRMCARRSIPNRVNP